MENKTQTENKIARLFLTRLTNLKHCTLWWSWYPSTFFAPVFFFSTFTLLWLLLLFVLFFLLLNRLQIVIIILVFQKAQIPIGNPYPILVLHFALIMHRPPATKKNSFHKFNFYSKAQKKNFATTNN